MKTCRWSSQVFVPAAASLTHSREDLQPGFSSWVIGAGQRILHISSFFSFRLFWVPAKIDFLLFVSWTRLTLSSPRLTLQGCLSTCMTLSFPLCLWAWLFVKSLWAPQWLWKGVYHFHAIILPTLGLGSALFSVCFVLWVFVFLTAVGVSRHVPKPALSDWASLTGETRRFTTWPEWLGRLSPQVGSEFPLDTNHFMAFPLVFSADPGFLHIVAAQWIFTESN